MAHRSWCAENPGTESNERLEFLGDAVLGLIVTAYVYREYPLLPEGHLAQVRASVVNSAALAQAAEELGLGEYLLLGKGEDASSGREKPTILADALEAVIGAVYLDGGWQAAEALVLSVLGDRITEAAAGPGSSDYKTRLQELAARRFEDLPRYDVAGEGPDHAKSFTATVSLRGRLLGTGLGRSKKQAEQAAARMAWETLAAEGATEPDAAEERPASPVDAAVPVAVLDPPLPTPPGPNPEEALGPAAGTVLGAAPGDTPRGEEPPGEPRA